jgi:hypothetical protein
MKTQALLAIMAVASVSAALAGCAGTHVGLPEPYKQGPVEIHVDRLYHDGDGDILGIGGTATNVSGRDLTMCEIEFGALSSDGTKIGQAIALTNDIKAGQKWQFEAHLTGVPFTPIAVFVPQRANWLPPIPGLGDKQ